MTDETPPPDEPVAPVEPDEQGERRDAGRPSLRPSQVRAAAEAERVAAGTEPEPAPAAWRVTFSYVGAKVTVVARRRVAMLAPPDDSAAVAAGNRGYWAEVRGADGAALYAQVLHQPIQSDWEVHNRHGVVPRHALPDEVRGAFEVVVPDLGDGTELVIHGRADIDESARLAPRQLAKVRLVADGRAGLMGATDGAVVSTTKIVDHGPDPNRWTLVILSEGYRAAELTKFHADADAFVGKLFATAPFDRLWCAVNVYRVDVSSTDSGADEPVACADDPSPGSGATPATFFDATYCFAATRRLLVGDQALALTTASTAVPEVDATVVIVNNPIYGGAGGSVAWFSTHAQASDIGIHELGHSAFRLDDEYGDLNDNWPGGEPFQPNVTTITDRATTKWAALIAPTTNLPTLTRGGACGADTELPSPVPESTVGLFEGGSRARCGIFHAMHHCKMRLLADPFCVVCQAAITTVLAPRLPAFSGPHVGRQFSGPVAAGATVTWFTYDWPACWHVAWTVVPTSPVTPVGGVRWRVRVQRTSRERIQYWVAVTNQTSQDVQVEGRYEVVATV